MGRKQSGSFNREPTATAPLRPVPVPPVRRLLSALCCPPSAVRPLLSALCCPPSAVRPLLSALCCPPSAVRPLLSPVPFPRFTLCCPLSPFFFLLFTCSPFSCSRSASPTGPSIATTARVPLPHLRSLVAARSRTRVRQLARFVRRPLDGSVLTCADPCLRQLAAQVLEFRGMLPPGVSVQTVLRSPPPSVTPSRLLLPAQSPRCQPPLLSLSAPRR